MEQTAAFWHWCNTGEGQYTVEVRRDVLELSEDEISRLKAEKVIG